MTYLKRLCWLLAWGGWAWLGVGLYRELPRDVGPMVWTLPLRPHEGNLGFWGDRQQIVTQEQQGEDKPVVLRVWDPETGALIRRLDGPIELSGARWKSVNFSRDMLVLAARRPPLPGRPDPTGPSVLDLETGEWRDLPVDPEMKQAYPWGKPWAAFYGRFKEDEPTRILVYDLCTGAMIYTWTDRTKQGEPYQLYRRPLFVGESLLLIPVHKPTGPNEPSDERWELWSIAENRRLKVFTIDIPLGAEPAMTPAGRIAWIVASEPPGIDVFDVHRGQIVLSYPPGRQPAAAPGQPASWPILSKDGRTLFSLDLDALVEVDTGRVLWGLRPENTERRWGPIRLQQRPDWISPSGFVVYESVTLPLLGEVVAADARSFATGPALLHRCRVLSHRDRYFDNRDGTLAYNTGTNTVHRWPPQVNRPLLAFCQALLALPLVLLWLGLRWRRRRRAGDVSPPVRPLADERTGGLTPPARPGDIAGGDGLQEAAS